MTRQNPAGAGSHAVSTGESTAHAPTYNDLRPRELAGSILRRCGVAFLHDVLAEGARLEAEAVAGVVIHHTSSPPEVDAPGSARLSILASRHAITEARRRCQNQEQDQ